MNGAGFESTPPTLTTTGAGVPGTPAPSGTIARIRVAWTSLSCAGASPNRTVAPGPHPAPARTTSSPGRAASGEMPCRRGPWKTATSTARDARRPFFTTTPTRLSAPDSATASGTSTSRRVGEACSTLASRSSNSTELPAGSEAKPEPVSVARWPTRKRAGSTPSRRTPPPRSRRAARTTAPSTTHAAAPRPTGRTQAGTPRDGRRAGREDGPGRRTALVAARPSGPGDARARARCADAGRGEAARRAMARAAARAMARAAAAGCRRGSRRPASRVRRESPAGTSPAETASVAGWPPSEGAAAPAPGMAPRPARVEAARKPGRGRRDGLRRKRLRLDEDGLVRGLRRRLLGDEELVGGSGHASGGAGARRRRCGGTLAGARVQLP